MELMDNEYLKVNGIHYLVKLSHEENIPLMDYLVKKILPLVDKPGKYTQIRNLCKKGIKKFGLESYEIDLINDKPYCVILRYSLLRGVMYSGDRCIDFSHEADGL